MACESEWQDASDAFDDFVDAWQAQDAAEERLEDERGFWEEETAGTGAGALGIAGAIIGGLAAGGVLGLAIGVFGTLAGGGVIVYSESDRQDDIDAATRDLDNANAAEAKADREWKKAAAAWCRCQAAESAGAAAGAIIVTPL